MHAASTLAFEDESLIIVVVLLASCVDALTDVFEELLDLTTSDPLGSVGGLRLGACGRSSVSRGCERLKLYSRGLRRGLPRRLMGREKFS